MIINKEFVFEAAHNLKNYKGKCSKLHGHRWKLIISIEGKINKEGMVMDFKKLKDYVEKRIISKLDHAYINDILENPTCENIVLWIKDNLSNLKGLYKIKLYETETSSVELVLSLLKK
jgi:6-pyruvoyltetrahydropterin/6-carboxytetrahydropterin synthase